MAPVGTWSRRSLDLHAPLTASTAHPGNLPRCSAAALLSYAVRAPRRMIDLHAHVLPGIDDGPAHLDGTLELLRRAVANRTRIIAATPHLRADHPRVRVEEIGPACQALQARIPASWNLQVVAGGEVDLLWAQDATDEQLRLAAYGDRGTDLLVETPYGPQRGLRGCPLRACRPRVPRAPGPPRAQRELPERP